MAETTPRFDIEQLANNAGNVQRVNTYQRIADAFLGGAPVQDRDLLTPPGSPNEGDLYLLPASGTLTGDWSAFTNGSFALYLNAAWDEITVDAAMAGVHIYVVDEGVRLHWTGTEWVETSFGVETGMSGTGTTQGGATAISAHFSEFTTVTGSDDAAVLPAARAGAKYVIRNADAADALSLFPASGDQINALATNAALSVAAGSTVVLYGTSAAQWYSH